MFVTLLSFGMSFGKSHGVSFGVATASRDIC